MYKAIYRHIHSHSRQRRGQGSHIGDKLSQIVNRFRATWFSSSRLRRGRQWGTDSRDVMELLCASGVDRNDDLLGLAQG